MGSGHAEESYKRPISGNVQNVDVRDSQSNYGFCLFKTRKTRKRGEAESGYAYLSLRVNFQQNVDVRRYDMKWAGE